MLCLCCKTPKQDHHRAHQRFKYKGFIEASPDFGSNSAFGKLENCLEHPQDRVYKGKSTSEGQNQSGLQASSEGLCGSWCLTWYVVVRGSTELKGRVVEIHEARLRHVVSSCISLVVSGYHQTYPHQSHLGWSWTHSWNLVELGIKERT